MKNSSQTETTTKVEKKAFYILKITEQTCTIKENLKMILNFNYDIFSLLLREKTGQMFHQKL